MVLVKARGYRSCPDAATPQLVCVPPFVHEYVAGFKEARLCFIFRNQDRRNVGEIEVAILHVSDPQVWIFHERRCTIVLA
jgi:hypothetical protein